MTAGELLVIFGLKPQGWEKGNKLIQGLASAARRYIGVQAIRSVLDLVDHATEAATHLVSLSQSVGLSIEKTQEWGYVAGQSGSNMKEFAVGLGMAERNLRMFADGRAGKSLQLTMSNLHMSTQDARDALASPEGLHQWLLKTSDTLKGMGNTPRRGELGQELFGRRAGRAMVADMARGSKALEELMERRRQMGELTTEQATGLRDLGNRLKDVKTSLSQLASQAIAKMAPTLLAMAEAAVKWIEANREVISGVLAGALKVVAGLFSAIGATISYLADLVHRAFAGDDGAIALVVGLAVAILSVLVPALWAMAAPIITTMLPLIAIAAIVAAITYAVLKWGPAIKKGAGEAWAWVKGKAQAFWDWLTSAPGRVLHALEDFGKRILEAFARVWEAIKQGASDAMHYVSEKARSIPVLGWLGEKVGQSAGYLASGGKGTEPDEDVSTRLANQMWANRQVGGGAPGGTSHSVTNNINVSAPIKIDGSKNPDATGGAVADHLDNQLRQAQRGVGGEVR